MGDDFSDGLARSMALAVQAGLEIHRNNSYEEMRRTYRRNLDELEIAYTNAIQRLKAKLESCDEDIAQQEQTIQELNRSIKRLQRTIGQQAATHETQEKRLSEEVELNLDFAEQIGQMKQRLKDLEETSYERGLSLAIALRVVQTLTQNAGTSSSTAKGIQKQLSEEEIFAIAKLARQSFRVEALCPFNETDVEDIFLKCFRQTLYYAGIQPTTSSDPISTVEPHPDVLPLYSNS